MTQLEIAEQLRGQIADKWPFVKEILELHNRNEHGQFNSYLKGMVDRLLPHEVFYQVGKCQIPEKLLEKPFIVGHLVNENNNSLFEYYIGINEPIQSIPIYQVLFGTEEKPLGNYY